MITELTLSLPPAETIDPTRLHDILRTRIEARCPARVVACDDAAVLALAVEDGIGAEGFRFEDTPTGVRVVGNDALGLLYGVGKFLRTSTYTPQGLTPSPWRGVSVPQATVRGMYAACHFHNWYHAAPADELTRYVEDLALWGVNTLMAIFPFIDLQGWEDDGAEPALQQTRRLFATAKQFGLRTCLGVGNTLFANTPAHLRATPVYDPWVRRGNSGAPICPNNPEADAFMRECHRYLFARLADIGLDYLCVWPYDEGGCGCERCAPWGANGFLKVNRELLETARPFFPQITSVLSTWMFDTPPEGEWEGLTRALAMDTAGISHILASSHEDFPRYPLEHGVPGGLPLLDFPEISMWGLYPWGGYGATPLPHRFQRIWNQAKDHLSGGFPYSEGIYEDINKVIFSQFYWNAERTAEETLREYSAYEFGPESADDVWTLASLIERSHTLAAEGKPVNPTDVHAAFALAESLDARLPEWGQRGWRWRILYLRAVLDQARYLDNDLSSPTSRAALQELITIFHARMVDDAADPYHVRLRPPLPA